MSEMIERVARAIWESRRNFARERGINLEAWGDPSLWDQPVPLLNGIMEEARAALEAMREPTEEMIRIGEDMSHPDGVWAVMIDAALRVHK